MSQLRQLAAVAALAIGATATAAAETVQLQWLGQAAVKLTAPDGRTILIDPFLTQNPKTPAAFKDLEAFGDVDLILVTHAHGDHVGDTPALAEQTGAKVALNADLGQTFATLGIVPREQLVRFNKSGPVEPLGEGIRITMVHAEHSSEFVHADAAGDETVHPGGEPAGYIIEFDNGPTVYHAGDTGVFGDMGFIGDYYEPDVALVPIGGHYTMDPTHAAYAVSELLQPDAVIPIHYGTFPVLEGTPEAFREALGDAAVEVVVMEPGDSERFDVETE